MLNALALALCCNKAVTVKDVRLLATQVITQVLQQQASLASLLPKAQDQVAERDQGLLQELCFGSLRWQPKLQSALNRLLEKPLKEKDRDIEALLLLGLYQLDYTRIPDHAAIGATVDITKKLKKPWASKLINGVLRQYQRQKAELHETLAKSPAFVTAHPNWLRKKIETSWPEQASNIFAANNQHPPFTIRTNQSRLSRHQYLQELQRAGYAAKATAFSDDGITFEQACDVTQLPGFADGNISVQDEAAQLAAFLMQLAPGQRVLDACCAPGGKTGHLLEAEPELKELVAVDLEQNRLARVVENLQRLKVEAKLICADVGDTQAWWDGKPFDRILLDAPCSATGVIRRHPDIKQLRKAEDIAKLAALQLQLLQALWPTLAPGGRLVYATCSVLPQENTQVVETFLAEEPTAVHEVIQAPWGIKQACGRQLLPQPQGHDGFFYACLRKPMA